jgi:hypothetical protein
MIPNLIPGIPYGPAPRTASVAGLLALPPRLIVIHDTSDAASAAGEAHYAATRTDPQANWTSCHAYIDTSGPLGSTPLTQPAWAAFSYANHNGWHLEMCGMNAGDPGAVPPATVAHTARLAAQLCDLAGIPKVHLSPADVAAGARGICGHYDITIGLGVGDHDDPGPRFDWGAFIGLVQQGGTDMEQKDPLTGPLARGSVADWAADDHNLRDWWYDVPGVTKFCRNPPAAGSRLDLLFKAVTAGLSDAQVQAIADRLVASSANGLTAADHAAVVEDVKAALRAGTA